jgi:rRNA small subunit pseudouridine methyltransferase Nep1
MLTVVLGEAELEMVPQDLIHHPAILSYAQQRGKQPHHLLLDSNYHHAAMTTLAEGRRRGRPDIVHLFLLTALESIVNKQEQLNIVVHTRNDDVITVNPKTRIMRNYERFAGLIEQLFEHHVVPDKKHPLLTLRQHITLQQVVIEATADHIILCSQKGKAVILPTYFKDLKKQKPHHILCIIGGFPSGSFHTDINTIADDTISLYPEMLPAWTVASEILVNYENASR